MRVLAHHLLRLLALALLVVLLVGVPVVTVVMVGLPTPSLDRWSDAWRTHRVELDLVVQLGTMLFLLLWCWFAVTAIAELARVVPHRHDVSAVRTPMGDGPSGWVRGLVRFVAVSGVGAGLVAGSGVGFAAPPAGVVHTVVAGDSYWEIAEAHLDQTLGREATGREVLVLTEALMERNAPLLGHGDTSLLIPGELVVVVEAPPASSLSSLVASPEQAPAFVRQSEPVVPQPVAPQSAPVVNSPAPAVAPPVSAPTDSPAPVSAVPVVVSADSSSPWPGLGGAAFLAAGALAFVEGRRRRRLRAAQPGARIDAPTFSQARTELLLRTLDAGERIARMDLAVRAASRDLATQNGSILAVALSVSGEVRLFVRGAAMPSSLHWRLDVRSGTWRLPATVALDELAELARDGVFPCPALVQLGVIDDNDGDELYVDLEAFGATAVPAAVAGALAASLALSPFRTSSAVGCVEVSGVAGLHGVDIHDLAEAESLIRRARTAGARRSAEADSSTFTRRALAGDGEAWEPEVLVIGGAPGWLGSLDDVAPGAGVALVVPEGTRAPASLRRDGDGFVFEPLGLRVRPVVVDDVELDALADLLHCSDEPTAVVPPRPIDVLPSLRPSFVEPEWDLLVRMIGQVEVVSPDGRVAQFVRSKSLELIVWMALHRERPTRSGARADMWEVGVRSATFANVVSEARRALAELTIPRDGEDWIGRTLTDDLPLHPRIVTDGDLLQARVDAARGLPHAAAIEILQPGLELVTGLPFSSPCFAWVDAQGHTSSLVLLATGAATELARHHLALGDIDGVFWATGRGLSVLSGHEELISLRMRAHASRGDLAGVRLEWEQYERALAADTWSSGEPSPKLVSLRRDLLTSPTRVPSVATIGA